MTQEVDLESLATEADDELKQLGDKWFSLLEQTDMTNPQNSFRTGLLRLAYPYARLVALSYGFQHAFGKGRTDENPFLQRVCSPHCFALRDLAYLYQCLSAASDVVNAVVDDVCRPSQSMSLLRLFNVVISNIRPTKSIISDMVLKHRVSSPLSLQPSLSK